MGLVNTGYRREGLVRGEPEGSSGPTTSSHYGRQQPASRTSPSPTQAPAGPQLQRRHRPCFVSMATGSAGARSKHNALWKTCGSGDPPAAPARGRDLRGPGVVEAMCSLASAPRGL